MGYTLVYFSFFLIFASGYLAIKQWLEPATIDSLLDAEDAGTVISEKNIARFTPEEWLAARESHFKKHYYYKIILFFSNTGRILTMEEAKSIFKFKSEPVLFDRLDEIFPMLQPESIYVAMILYFIEQRKGRTRKPVSPAQRDDQTKAEFLEVFPGMNFEIFIPEQLRQDEKFLTDKSTEPYRKSEQ